MEKIHFIKSRFDAQWAFQLNDGKLIEIMNKEGHLVLRYDTPFNLKTGVIYDTANQAPRSAVTLNELKKMQMGDTVFCYDEYDVNLGFIKTLSERRINQIIKKFKSNGFNVTKEAILHNYNAWRCDFKSGYRDEENDYHLFSPCGCNPFQLRATNLVDFCSEWQITYTF